MLMVGLAGVCSLSNWSSVATKMLAGATIVAGMPAPRRYTKESPKSGTASVVAISTLPREYGAEPVAPHPCVSTGSSGFLLFPNFPAVLGLLGVARPGPPSPPQCAHAAAESTIPRYQQACP